MSQGEPRVSDDLSSDESLPLQNQKIIDNELEEIQDRIKFKRWLFYCIVGMSIVFTGVLLAYIAMPYIALLCLSSDSSKDIIPKLFEAQPERLMVIGTMAALIILLPLALIRVIYQPAKTKEDSGDSVSIWQSLVKELLDILRKYVDNKNN